MKRKFGIYANCSEWNEEVGPSYRDDDISAADAEYFAEVEKATLEDLKEKEWD